VAMHNFSLEDGVRAYNKIYASLLEVHYD
jgi:hypothetical protein